MSNLRPPSRRALRARHLVGRGGAAVAVTLAALASAPGAHAADAGDVQLTSVFAKPIVAAPYPATARINGQPGSPLQNDQSYCTPEPSGRRVYGTQVAFDPNKFVSTNALGTEWPASTSGGYPASPDYVAANFPSRDSLVPALGAGESNDLCFGFTLSPNVQPDLILQPGQDDTAEYKRLQDDPKVPDVPGTHVSIATDGNGVETGLDADDLKNVSIDMPAGFLGDPDGIPTCSDAQFGLGKYLTDACPANSQLGTVFARVTALLNLNSGGPLKLHYASGGAPNPLLGSNGKPRLANGGNVFNLEHGPNELGRLGVSIQPVQSGIPPTKFVVKLALAPDGSGRVRTVVENAPRNLYSTADINADGTLKAGATPLPIYLESVGIRAWGNKAAHPTLNQDFAEWGTSCAPATASVSAETYLGAKSSMTSDPITLTGCDQLAFLPSVSVETSEKRPAVPTATTVTVGFGQTTSGPRSALLKDARVTLPAGLELGAQAGSGPNGLPLCTAAQFGFDQQDKANGCPEASKTGSLTILTPLQSRPFVGSIYLGEQPAVGELPALYLEASPEGATAADAPRIKLKGQVSVDAEGNITTTFLNNPQLRFNELRLAFPGGDNALFSTPRTCGETTGNSTFTSWASETPVPVASKLVINEACDTPGFAPTFSMTAADNTVGISSPTTVTLAREDRSPWLKDFNVSLPSGFLADLNLVTECPAAQADLGACPESSRMGSVTAAAGVGPKPLSLTGQMYMANRQSGAVAGAVIVVRAKIGEIDLGDVIVPARIDLRPTDAGLVLTASAPTRFKGLALNLRSFAVNLDRPGFPLNPTACGPLTASAALTADNGATAAPTTSVTYAGCSARPLAPTITPTLSGELKANGHPSLRVQIATRPGDTNLKSTVVTLPTGVAADLPNLKNLCPVEAFNAANCAANTKVGTVAANVSITSETIPGDLHLVKIAGEPLPGLGMNITGRYAQRILSVIRIDKTGRLVTAFESIPDLPLTKLDLSVNGGAGSPLIVSDKLCAAPSAWESTFGGQGGQTSVSKVPFDCTTPSAKETVKWSRKTGIKLTFTAPAGKTVKSYKLTMPSGFKVKTSKSSIKKYLKVTAKGGKVKTKITSKSLALVASGAGPSTITLTLKPKGYSLPKTKAYKKGLAKNKKLKLKVRGVTSDGKVAASTKTVKTS
ncbi:MAG: hypothetical protein Q7T55_13655 [Solirubrobacteraceae bacterium]|nr:hypothetical protein [Solirubrobacteraceae bacterium]